MSDKSMTKYKRFKFKRFDLTYNKFPKTAKNIKSVTVYKSGFHYWTDDEDENYSMVIGVFRLILSIPLKNGCCDTKCETTY